MNSNCLIYRTPLNNELKLFRYISLSTLINMLYNSTLYVSNMQSFSDIREKKA